MLKRAALRLGLVGAVCAAAVAALAVGGLTASGADKGKSVVIDGVRYADHGMKDVRNMSRLPIEADDHYFSPTFMRGKPGQKLTLVVESEGRLLHNITIAPLGIDKDIPPKGKVQVDVTFPASGVLMFSCKFHGGLGMNGQLQVGDGAPVGGR